MATLIDDGWLYLTDGSDIMEIMCREISWDNLRSPDITHEVGGMHYGYDLGETYIIVKASGLLFKSKANKETFCEKMNSWLDSGTIDLKIQATSGGAYEKLDGVYTTLPVFCPKGWSGITKIAKGDGVVYEIGKISFEQAGDAS